MPATKKRKPQAERPPVSMSLPHGRTFGLPRPTNFDSLLRFYRAEVSHFASLNSTHVSGCLPRLYVALGRGEQANRPTRALTGMKQAQIRAKATGLRARAARYEEITEHNLLDLTAQPNPYMTGRELIYATELYLGLLGNAYWLMSRGPLGAVNALWPLPASRITIIPGESRMIDAYRYEWQQQRRDFAPEDVLHFRIPNPQDPYGYGFSPLLSEADTAVLGSAIDEYEINVFKNGGMPDGVFLSDTPLTKDQADRKRLEWQDAYGGNNRGRSVGWVSGTNVRWQPLSTSPKDISYLKGSEKVRDRLAAAFGIPKSMTTTNDVNLANADAGKRQYAEQTWAPRLRLYEEMLTRLAEQFDPRLWVEFDSVIPVDRKLESEIDAAYANAGILLVDEIRERMNLPPIPGGDVPAFARQPALPAFPVFGPMNPVRRFAHLNESQRAMVAGRIASLPDGVRADRQGVSIDTPSPTRKQAAEMLNVGEPSVGRARRVLNRGTPELVEAVEKGDVSVYAASALAIDRPTRAVKQSDLWAGIRGPSKEKGLSK